MNRLIEKYHIKPQFFQRYFQQNAEYEFAVRLREYMLWKRGKFLLPTHKSKYDNEFLTAEIDNFYNYGEINLPRIDFPLTLRCTLRCRDCAVYSLTQCKDDRLTRNLDSFKHDFDALLDAVNSIKKLNFVGGEPLLNKSLAEMVMYSAENKKVRLIEIVTNGTVIPSLELLDAAEKYRYKVCFFISNYSTNPELASRLKHGKMIELLKSRQIQHILPVEMLWGNEYALHEYNYTNEELKSLFRRCRGHQCVTVLNGKMGVCAKSSIAYELDLLKIPDEDFVDLHRRQGNNLQQEIINFYSRDYFTACRYCALPDKSVPAALQAE